MVGNAADRLRQGGHYILDWHKSAMLTPFLAVVLCLGMALVFGYSFEYILMNIFCLLFMYALLLSK